MDLTILLDVVIGMSLVYLAASLFVTIINEYIGQMLKLRSKQLAQNLRQLIDGEDALAVLKSNPALAPFFTEGQSGGSYVDTKMLAEQLVGGLRKGADAVATMDDLIESINGMNDSAVKTHLLALSQVAAGNVDKFIKSTGAWFDQSLTMMGEVYKKRMQVISFLIGLGVAVMFNLNTLSLGSYLYRDADAREAVATLATGLVEQVSGAEFERCSALPLQDLRSDPGCTGLVTLIEGIRQRNDTFGDLPIGWPPRPARAGELPVYITSVPGWILTALAISLGASFWFDLLSRVVNLRHGMRKPQTETGS